MLKSYQEIFTFSNTANAWLAQNPTEDSRFAYALRKVLKRATSIATDYQEKVEDINIEHCATDDKGIILREPSTDPRKTEGEFRFSKEGLLERNRKRNELFKRSVEIEPHFATEIPTLSIDEQEVFLGFVLKEVVEEAPIEVEIAASAEA